MIYLIVYLMIINLTAFFIYGIDKRKSIKGKWRIKETTLLAFSLLGGGIGSLLGMSTYRHKTQKTKFRLGVPILTVISIALIYLLITTLNLSL
ncbi:MAG: DUF1294 domain-containing protein [Firmicutes bacterium]|nr:DUF1294 domain-containing protein [Bacillota bacterium]